MTDINDETLRSRLFSELLRKNRDKVQRKIISRFRKTLDYHPLNNFMISESAWKHVSTLDVDPKFVFAHPDMLTTHPTTSLYYRGLALLSQKQVSQMAKNISKWEDEYQTAHVKLDSALAVSRVYNTMISSIIEGSSNWTMHNGYRNIVATMAVTIDGTYRNKIGQIAENLVKDRIVSWLRKQGLIESETSGGYYQLPHNTLMKYGSEPDIDFTRDGYSVATVEVKGGRDSAAALERLGAWTKSFTETPAGCTNFLIAGVITEEMQSRIKKLGVVKKAYLLDGVAKDGEYWEDFINELFHHALRIC